MLLNRERAEELMDRERLDAIVASTPINVYYLSGWSTEATWGFGDVALAVLPRSRELEPAVATAEVDAGKPQQFAGSWMKILRPYRRRPGLGIGGRPTTDPDVVVDDTLPLDHTEVVSDYLREIGLSESRVGFDDRGLGMDIAAECAGLEAVGARDLLREIRLVKTPEELDFIRAATRKTEVALLSCVEAIAAGATSAEAERVFWAVLAQIGGTPVFLLITPYRPGFGRLEKDAVLQPGDTITFDATGHRGHYTTDIGRTAVIGEPSEEQLKAYAAMRAGWSAAIAEFVEGRDSLELERVVTASVQSKGNHGFTGCTIHSVGLEHTDHPHPGNSLGPFTLMNGAVVSCDVLWENRQVGRFHLEDLSYLTPHGVELLNDPDSRIFACSAGRAWRIE